MKKIKVCLVLILALCVSCKTKKHTDGMFHNLIASCNKDLFVGFIEDLKSKNYSKVYENMTEICKKFQSEEDLKMLLNFHNQLYGDLNSYSINIYKVQTQFGFDKPVASVIYDVDYAKCSGKIYGTFLVENKDTIRLQAVRFIIKDSSQFSFIDSLTAPFFKDLKEKSFPDIYNNLLSERCRSYTPIIKFEAYMNDVRAVKIDTLLNTQNIGLSEKHLVLYLAYQTDSLKKKLNLTYVKYGDVFLIEGINLN